jgi:hypothetical protein
MRGRPRRAATPRTWIAAAALAALVLLVFGQTARHGFVLFDDETYILDNPVVGAGLTLPGSCGPAASTPATGIRSPGSRTCSTCSSSGCGRGDTTS